MSAIINDIEDFIAKKRIEDVFKEFFVQMYLKRPESPEKFLFDYLQLKYPDIVRAEPSLLGGSLSTSAADGLSVSIQHSVPAEQQYLESTGMRPLLTGLLLKLLEDKPDDARAFLVAHLQQEGGS